MSEIHVKVTEAHIRLGKREDCRECAIALAIEEQVPNKVLETVPKVKVFDANEIEVWGKRYSVSGGKDEREMVNEFMYHFDEGKPVDPIEFTIEPYVKELTYDY
jgi:hypothetical protein